MPIIPEKLPVRLSESRIQEALDSDATAQIIMSKNLMPTPGQLIGVRLNLNVLKNTGVAVQTLHAATNQKAYQRNKGFYKGEAIGYAQTVVLKDAFFNVSQEGREAIVSGQRHKFPMASVDGILVGLTPQEDFEGVPLRFNPKEGHLFTDLDGFAIHSAEEVVIQGHRAFARGRLTYYTQENAPPRKGDSPSQVRFKTVKNLPDEGNNGITRNARPSLR